MSESNLPPGASASPEAAAPDTEQGQISQNIEAVQGFYTREGLKISRSQRVLERISRAIGKPSYLGFILVFVVLWVVRTSV